MYANWMFSETKLKSIEVSGCVHPSHDVLSLLLKSKTLYSSVLKLLFNSLDLLYLDLITFYGLCHMSATKPLRIQFSFLIL